MNYKTIRTEIRGGLRPPPRHQPAETREPAEHGERAERHAGRRLRGAYDVRRPDRFGQQEFSPRSKLMDAANTEASA